MLCGWDYQVKKLIPQAIQKNHSLHLLPVSLFTHKGTLEVQIEFVCLLLVRGNRYLLFSSYQKPIFSDGLVNNHACLSGPVVPCPHISSRNGDWVPKPHPLLAKAHAHLWMKNVFSLLLTPLSVYSICNHIPQNFNMMIWHEAEICWKLWGVFFRAWPQRWNYLSSYFIKTVDNFKNLISQCECLNHRYHRICSHCNS